MSLPPSSSQPPAYAQLSQHSHKQAPTLPFNQLHKDGWRSAVIVAVALLSALLIAGRMVAGGLAACSTTSSLYTPHPATFSWDSCTPLDPQIIVYNRIPKAGSTTLISLLTTLATLNDFDLILPEPYYDHAAARNAILSALVSGKKTIICNHFNFPEILYSDRIAYINVMRHPVDRCTSWYYYTRYGDRNRDLKAGILQQYGGETLDDCAAKPQEQLRTCLNCDADTQSQAFCGREDGPCRAQQTSAALSQAWSNVRSHYFVGLTEDLNGTAMMLEQMYPSFFRGGVAAMDAAGGQPRKKVTSSREEYVAPSEQTSAVLATWLAPDMELYRRVGVKYWTLKELCEAQRRRPGGTAYKD